VTAFAEISSLDTARHLRVMSRASLVLQERLGFIQTAEQPATFMATTSQPAAASSSVPIDG
jgi:hypothetical protein